MKKIAIVCDSSVSFTPEEIKHFDVKIAPLTVMNNNHAYIDEVTITKEEVNNLLRNKERVTTSQPSIGFMIELFESMIDENYDHVFVLSIGTALSGSYPSFQQAVHESGLQNTTVINTHTITGPVQQAVRGIREYNERGESIETIQSMLDKIFSDTISYVYPETLEQVVLSGRMSKTAQKIASLLRVKPMLYLENKGVSIEKRSIGRTDRKAFQALVDDMTTHHVKPETHDLYLLESEGMAVLEACRDYLFEKLGTFKYYIIPLPAAVATHAGLGTIAIQWAPKY